MKIKVAFLTLVMLATFVIPAFARSFPKAHNFMSQTGFARWQYYMGTGRWLPR